MRNMHIVYAAIFICSILFSPLSAYSDQKKNTGKPNGYITLKTKDNRPFNVYMAGPTDARRGILLIHEWWGLNEVVRGWADEFAAAGYRAMAIDLYNGKVATDPKVARKLMSSVNQAEANKKYSAALNALKAPGRKLATIGWSFGGSQALQATLSKPELVSATVSYYPFGAMVSDKEKLAPMKGPILIQVGSEDFAFTPDKARKYSTAIRNAGKTLTMHTYKAKHAFNKPSGKNYSKQAHEMATKSTYEFLEANLK